jgi:multiple sugar transport system permease protein
MSTLNTASPRRAWLWTLGGVAILAVFLFPVYWMVSASLQPDVDSVSVSWLPTTVDVGSYERALRTTLPGLRNSIIVSLGTVLLTLLVSVPAAFALSRLDGRIVNVALLAILVAQMVPSITLLNALYAMFSALGILNTYLAMILANSTSAIPLAIIVLRSFMVSLDSEILEAATIDGATLWQRITRIVLPLSRNAVITASVFAFIFTWGDLLFGLILTTQSTMQPVVLSVYRLLDQPTIDWSTVMAASFLTSLPAIALLVFSLRYVQAGIGAGAGK